MKQDHAVGVPWALELKRRQYLVEKARIALEHYFGRPSRTPMEDPLDSLIQTILSQNTNDANRDKAFRNLKESFPSWQEALSAGREAIQEAIKVAGISRVKSNRIMNILEKLNGHPHGLSLKWIGKVPAKTAEDFLLSFEGVGMKTARCVMLFELGHPVFPVDTHILRVTKRLGWVPARCSADRAHEILHLMVPQDAALSLHLNMILLGRRFCRPKRPRCGECPLLSMCPTGQANQDHPQAVSSADSTGIPPKGGT